MVFGSMEKLEESEASKRDEEFVLTLCLLVPCRCNNVLWISGGKGVKQEDVKMDG